jgi:hypothetical protein
MDGLLASAKQLPTALTTLALLLASAKQSGRHYPEYRACVRRDVDIDAEALREHAQYFNACGGYWFEGLALGAVGIGHNNREWEQAIALAIAVAMAVTQLAAPPDCPDDFTACVEQAAKLLDALPPPHPPRGAPDSSAPPPPCRRVGRASLPPCLGLV